MTEDPSTQSRRAFDYVLSQVPERRKGDDRSRLLNLFVAKLSFEAGGEHWIWTAAMTERSGRRYPRFSFAAHGSSRQVAAFQFLVRSFFPSQYVPRFTKYSQTCGEERCVSPYHRTARDMTRVRYMSKRSLSEADAEVVLLRALGGNEPQRVIATEYGICQQTVAQIKRGSAWPAVFERVTGRSAPRRAAKPAAPKREYRYEPQARRKQHRITPEQRRQVVALWDGLGGPGGGASIPLTKKQIAQHLGLGLRTVERAVAATEATAG